MLKKTSKTTKQKQNKKQTNKQNKKSKNKQKQKTKQKTSKQTNKQTHKKPATTTTAWLDKGLIRILRFACFVVIFCLLNHFGYKFDSPFRLTTRSSGPSMQSAHRVAAAVYR